MLKDVRVRQALAYAIDREAIVEYLRRGLAVPATGMLLAAVLGCGAGRVSVSARSGEGAGAARRGGLSRSRRRWSGSHGCALTLKVSNSEFNRLQSSVIQQNLRDVGVDLDVRTYEFATLYADVLSGQFPAVHAAVDGGRPGGSRTFSAACSTRTRCRRPGSIAAATAIRRWTRCSTGRATPEDRGGWSSTREVQRIIARDVPYVSLWYKTNVAVARRELTGVRLTPLADYYFLKDVASVAAGDAIAWCRRQPTVHVAAGTSALSAIGRSACAACSLAQRGCRRTGRSALALPSKSGPTHFVIYFHHGEERLADRLGVDCGRRPRAALAGAPCGMPPRR